MTPQPLPRHSERPAYGAQQIVLLPAKRNSGRKYRIVLQVFTEDGFTTTYDHDAKDWLNWQGSWKDVETLAMVNNREEATAFMVARQESSAHV